MSTPLECLEVEIGHCRNSLLNAIICRKQHPSYGYTKADILETLNRLRGLLQAWTIIRSGEASATPAFDTLAAAEQLDIDIISLIERAKAA